MTYFSREELVNAISNDFDKLVNIERKEFGENCYDKFPVSFWEYAKALFELEKDCIIGSNAKGKSGWAYNKALAFLFSNSCIVTAGDVAKELGYGYDSYAAANLRLGEFGNKLREKLGHLTNDKYAKNEPYDVNLCSFISFAANPKSGVLFILRERFRTALAECFGDDEIKLWLAAPKLD